MKLRLLPILCLVVTFASASAQAPAAKLVAEVDLDRIAIDVLKEMHNKGAELYNAGEPSGCLKIYGTALLTVKPFLKHRPAIQKSIDDGIAEVEKAEGAKLQAFKMHGLIEKIRADLQKPESAAEPGPPVLSGTITLDGKKLADATITVSSGKRAFTTSTNAEGIYTFADSLPPGDYAAIVTGAGVPEHYRTVGSAGIAIKVTPGKNTGDVALIAK